MLLTSADTKSLSEHEENSSNHNNNNNNNSDDNNLSELSSPNDELTTRCSSSAHSSMDSMATTTTPPPPPAVSGEGPAIETSSSSSNDDDDDDALAQSLAAERREDSKEPLTQLSVSAEENSAFKDYIDAQQTDEDDDADDDVEMKKVDDLASAAAATATVELRLLVRRREAGALIGKKGANIKRLRDTFRSSMFSIPDTGNGPERVVCITSEPAAIDAILGDITGLLLEKSPENEEQVELKLLIHSSHAGSIIGIGGQSIKRLRNESKAAIKIYEMCCPLSNERVCAIKARPPIVVSTIKLIQSILQENPIKGTIKPYDALHFDLTLIDKYGGYLPEEPPIDLFAASTNTYAAAAAAAAFGHESCYSQKHFNNPAGWRRPAVDYCDPCENSSAAFQKSKRDAAAAAANNSNNKSDQDQNQDQLSSRLSKFDQRHHPANRAAGSRFHPYASSSNYPSRHHHHHRAAAASNLSRHSPSSSALHYPSAFPASASAAAAALIAAVGHHQSSRAPPYAHLAAAAAAAANHQQLYQNFAGPRANQFLYPNGGGGSGPGGCRHGRPCLCMLLPMMHHDEHRHHHQHESTTASMLAAYAQMGPLGAGEEFNSMQFHHSTQTANDQQQQQQRKETTNGDSVSNRNK